MNNTALIFGASGQDGHYLTKFLLDKNYKVLDTFLYNGEFEMLKMRLDYLYDSVDYFVICESDYTQNGTPTKVQQMLI